MLLESYSGCGYLYCIYVLTSSGLQTHQNIARLHPLEGKDNPCHVVDLAQLY